MRYDEDLLVEDVQEDEVDITGILANSETKKQQVDKRRRIEDILSDKELRRVYGDPLAEGDDD